MKIKLTMDAEQLVKDMKDEYGEIVPLIAEQMGASDFVDTFADHSAEMVEGDFDLTERGIQILDVFVARAVKLGRMPEEDWEPDWVADLRAEMDRLQRLIVEGRTGEALDLLRDAMPDHQFLSPTAEQMLAGIHGQGALAL